MDKKQELLSLLKNVPKKPGTYLWKDQFDNVIYVGKANNLHNRMNSYFKGNINSFKTYAMFENIYSFDYFIADSPKAALILEKKYIDQYRPKYNIMLLDDKQYPYLNIKIKDSLEIKQTYRVSKNSEFNIYYGPYPQSHLFKFVKILQRIFLYNQGLLIKGKPKMYWIEKFNTLKEILKFKNNDFNNLLKEKMIAAADNLNFEAAIEYQKALEFISQFKEKQIIEISKYKNYDVFSFEEKNESIAIFYMLYIYGVQNIFQRKIIENYDSLENIISNFLKEFYKNKALPDNIILDYKYKDLNLDLDFKSKIIFPQKGINHDLIKLANENNNSGYESYLNQKIILEQHKLNLWKNLASELFLDKLNSIFIFDNSHFNNSSPIGSCICYTKAEKNPHLYASFNHEKEQKELKIKSDIEYMYHSVYKYLKRNHLFITKDDIFILDGSSMQIKFAQKAILDFNKDFNANLEIKLFGLVKDKNHKTNLIINSKDEIIKISNESFLFLSKIQEEVDLFAKKRMQKNQINLTFKSRLIQIKGISYKTEEKLLKHFGTFANIYNASFEELQKITNKSIAQKIKENLDIIARK
ncbi:excinuclease ABC subunit C [Mycoplasma synoviae GX11-T]|nr:GIY-YIG nuclease family protein [Mycoplasmopsis synoviae]MBD5788929.1 excinuclease ABC subunit C [Mycoplasmopsis synoviae GX11-T]